MRAVRSCFHQLVLEVERQQSVAVGVHLARSLVVDDIKLSQTA